MAHSNSSATQQVPSGSMVKTVLTGALIGLVLISLFLFSADDPNPEWGKFWWIRPLIVVPIAGAMAGLFYDYMGYFREQDGAVKLLAIILSILGYIVALWLSSVVGLDGTYWN